MEMSQEPLTWSAFQSLFQLSVGLNTAISVLYDFFGSNSQRRITEIRQWKARANDLEADWHTLVKGNHPTDTRCALKLPPKVETLPGEFALLEGHLVDLQDTNENIILNYIRWICLAFAGSSFVFLAISSFYANGRINVGFQVWAIIQCLPFIAGLVVVVVMAAKVYLKTREMIGLQRSLLSEERIFLAARNRLVGETVKKDALKEKT